MTTIQPLNLANKLLQGRVYSFTGLSVANKGGNIKMGVVHQFPKDYLDQTPVGFIRPDDQFIVTGVPLALKFSLSELRTVDEPTFVYVPVMLTNKPLMGWLALTSGEWNEFWPVEVSESSPIKTHDAKTSQTPEGKSLRSCSESPVRCL